MATKGAAGKERAAADERTPEGEMGRAATEPAPSQPDRETQLEEALGALIEAVKAGQDGGPMLPVALAMDRGQKLLRPRDGQ
jgi:hypothetical protein